LFQLLVESRRLVGGRERFIQVILELEHFLGNLLDADLPSTKVVA